ncbi:MAG: UDP-N-acetylmuramoyl-L-alanine--D-glutamate ligase [Candidatus Desulfofervidaceae bacterium]|nr:UDP-N-acetylmuramoyl-L-alanine--D-glutamate ligase [Candidatus Desulfofervidaceae bacterium]
MERKSCIEIKNKHFVVVGLGKTGASLTRFLLERGGRVTISDSASLERIKPQLETLKGFDFQLETGGHREETFLKADYIIVSPGVPLNLPIFQSVRNRGIPILGELDLVGPFLSAPIIAITGTNGKTTTTNLIGKILAAHGKKVWVGGNIGTPLAEATDDPSLDYIVAEISSFQLEPENSFHPWIGICLNVSVDHLDRHADFNTYLQTKLKLYWHQTTTDWCILEGDNQQLVQAARGIKSKKLFFGTKDRHTPGAYLKGEKIVVEVNQQWTLDTKNILLKGKHNYKNIMASLLVAQITGCDFQTTTEVISRFSGLPHRIELVRSVHGIAFYNDSKGTNVDATLAALDTLPDPIVLIAGGLGKGQDFSPLRPLVATKTKAVVVIGAAATEIANALGNLTPVVRAKTMEEAVKKAWQLARPRGSVLLSPACASFDMFKDYRERGEIFKKVVYAL